MYKPSIISTVPKINKSDICNIDMSDDTSEDFEKIRLKECRICGNGEFIDLAFRTNPPVDVDGQKEGGPNLVGKACKNCNFVHFFLSYE